MIGCTVLVMSFMVVPCVLTWTISDWIKLRQFKPEVYDEALKFYDEEFAKEIGDQGRSE